MEPRKHMIQKSGVYGKGWVRCGRGIYFAKVHRWCEVTCKQCLKHKEPWIKTELKKRIKG